MQLELSDGTVSDNTGPETLSLTLTPLESNPFSPAAAETDPPFVLMLSNGTISCLIEDCSYELGRAFLFLNFALGDVQLKPMPLSRSMRSCDSLSFLYCCLCLLTHVPSFPRLCGTLQSPCYALYWTSSPNRVSQGTFGPTFINNHLKPMPLSRSMRSRSSKPAL